MCGLQVYGLNKETLHVNLNRCWWESSTSLPTRAARTRPRWTPSPGETRYQKSVEKEENAKNKNSGPSASTPVLRWGRSWRRWRAESAASRQRTRRPRRVRGWGFLFIFKEELRVRRKVVSAHTHQPKKYLKVVAALHCRSGECRHYSPSFDNHLMIDCLKRALGVFSRIIWGGKVRTYLPCRVVPVVWRRSERNSTF